MTAETILGRVTGALDALVSAADPYEGLFPSIIDRQTNRMMDSLPPAIEGQRDGDRSHLGSNLIHDQALLKTMFALATEEGRGADAVAANRYLRRFSTHCTNTPTGMFPWGEHAYWHLRDDAIGNSYLLRHPPRNRPVTHDHLRQAPLWLWQKIQEHNPDAVLRFASGLDYHWTEGEPEEYVRHAYIEDPRPYQRSNRSCDFPRHGGFYIFDWAFAFSQAGRMEDLARIRRMLDYWWCRRDERNLLQIESRSPVSATQFFGINNPGQTLSLGVSLIEAASLVASGAPDLAGVMCERGHAYIKGFLSAPHDPTNRVFVLSCRRGSNEITRSMPIWGSTYGVWPVSYMAEICVLGFRLTQDERLLEWAAAAGRAYLEEPMSDSAAVPAMDAGLGLGLLADLYDVTGKTQWLESAIRMGSDLVSAYFEPDVPLPRGATGIDWYESQMGPGFLIHGLARTALLARYGEACPLDADYTAR